jgi:hypothetical protein
MNGKQRHQLAAIGRRAADKSIDGEKVRALIQEILNNDYDRMKTAQGHAQQGKKMNGGGIDHRDDEAIVADNPDLADIWPSAQFTRLDGDA